MFGCYCTIITSIPEVFSPFSTTVQNIYVRFVAWCILTVNIWFDDETINTALSLPMLFVRTVLFTSFCVDGGRCDGELSQNDSFVVQMFIWSIQNCIVIALEKWKIRIPFTLLVHKYEFNRMFASDSFKICFHHVKCYSTFNSVDIERYIPLTNMNLCRYSILVHNKYHKRNCVVTYSFRVNSNSFANFYSNFVWEIVFFLLSFWC